MITKSVEGKAMRPFMALSLVCHTSRLYQPEAGGPVVEEKSLAFAVS